MKTGIELITGERQNQISKGYSIEFDTQTNNEKQLLDAATQLISYNNHLNYADYEFNRVIPIGWNQDVWLKLCRKSYLERLIIAGALISAEIDRVNK